MVYNIASLRRHEFGIGIIETRHGRPGELVSWLTKCGVEFIYRWLTLLHTIKVMTTLLYSKSAAINLVTYWFGGLVDWIVINIVKDMNIEALGEICLLVF